MELYSWIVDIENSQPDFARTVNGVPAVSTQHAQTQTRVPDGNTMMIGGIFVDTDSLNVRQVPGLGSIPLIGHLFKNTQTIKSQAELFFFITPRIKKQDAVATDGPEKLSRSRNWNMNARVNAGQFSLN